MDENLFFTKDGIPVPYVSERQMREIDRIANQDFGISILQMMENAGRSLALQAIKMLGSTKTGIIAIAAGTGGNGGGGLCAARHLHNRGYKVRLLLTIDPAQYLGPAGVQLNILQNAGLAPTAPDDTQQAISTSDLVIDALIGYSLIGPPQGTTAHLIDTINREAKQVLSLDLPSGISADNPNPPGIYIQAKHTLTLALPKPGLVNPASGRLFLADIRIPPEVFSRIEVVLPNIFKDQFIVQFKPHL